METYDYFANEQIKIETANKMTAANGKLYESERVFIAAFQHIDKERKAFFTKK